MTIQTAKWILTIRKFVATKYINRGRETVAVVKLASSEGWLGELAPNWVPPVPSLP